MEKSKIGRFFTPNGSPKVGDIVRGRSPEMAGMWPRFDLVEMTGAREIPRIRLVRGQMSFRRAFSARRNLEISSWGQISRRKRHASKCWVWLIEPGSLRADVFADAGVQLFRL